MIFRFFSGSVTPSSFERNKSDSSNILILTPSPVFKARTQSRASFFRSKPWSIKTAVDLLPMALCNNAATTVESTPPLTPTRTFPSPTCFRMSSTCSSIKFPAVQLGAQFATLNKKFRRMVFPASVWATSG